MLLVFDLLNSNLNKDLSEHSLRCGPPRTIKLACQPMFGPIPILDLHFDSKLRTKNLELVFTKQLAKFLRSAF